MEKSAAQQLSEKVSSLDEKTTAQSVVSQLEKSFGDEAQESQNLA